jgi:hypothetical protein
MPEDFSNEIPEHAWVAAYDGHMIDIANPEVGMIHEEDVFKSLARRPRYGGFLDTPIDELYSVAQHAVYVSRLVAKYQRERDVMGIYHALHHDSAEYILMDVVSPMKRILPDYKALEAKWNPIINEKFGIIATPEREEMTHWADRRCFMHEAAQFERVDVHNRNQFEKLFEVFPGDKVMKPSEAYAFFKFEDERLRAEIAESWTAEAV